MGTDFLSLLSLYGPGATSQGQPVGGGLPQQPPPASGGSPDPAEEMGGRQGGFDWKDLLVGGLGAIGSGLLGGKEGAASFGANFANAKHQQNLQLREQEHQTQKAIADQAHKAWQELQGTDFSVLPPELSHLQGKATELNQRYVQAIAKDSPGGVTISPKEAQEIIALSSVLRGAKEKVGTFQQQEQKLDLAASPYTSAIRSGQMEPPPGAERIAELGLDDAEASRLAGREAFNTAELTRQRYDTPTETEYGLMTPRDQLTQRNNDVRARQALEQQKAMEAERLRRDADRDAAEAGKEDRFNRSQAGMNARFAEAMQMRGEHFNDRNQIPQGASDKILGMAETRKQIQELLPNLEKIKSRIGPLAGRISLAELEKAGGSFGLTPEEMTVLNQINTLLKTETFRNAGQAVSIGEKKLAQSNLITPLDGIELALVKGKELDRIFSRDMTRRVMSLPAAGQRQMQDMLKFDGFDTPDFGLALPPVPSGYKRQRNKRTGEVRVVPIQ